MGLITWDKLPERLYHQGLDRGVLYAPNYIAVPFNGLTSVDEDSNSSSTIYYIDGQIYLADLDPGDFSGSMTAFAYPDYLSACLGIQEASLGLFVDNQKPSRFGMSYRTLIGSGDKGDMFGYQIHLLYNVMASIKPRSRKTINDNVSPLEFQFDLTATPIKMTGFRPAAHYILDTRHLTPAHLLAVEQILYGYQAGDSIYPARLPDPDFLNDLLGFGSAITYVDNGDGTWTATGSALNVYYPDADTYAIHNTNGVDYGDGTYLLQDTL